MALASSRRRQRQNRDLEKKFRLPNTLGHLETYLTMPTWLRRYVPWFQQKVGRRLPRRSRRVKEEELWLEMIRRLAAQHRCHLVSLTSTAQALA